MNKLQFVSSVLCLQRAAHSFQPQMKLEAVDKRSPGLIRVATVEEVETHRIKAGLCLFVLSSYSMKLRSGRGHVLVGFFVALMGLMTPLE